MPEIVIIGAGIVGVSTAYQLNKLQPNWKIKIIEKESQVASHQTGHNSGVIHSGIYYKPGSLKAQNCIRGYDFLIEFCRKKNIPFEVCGKVIVALNETQLDALDKLYHRGIENGLKGLEYLNSSQIKEIEPHCTGIKGIKVPQTGIVAYKRVTEEMKKDLEASNTVEFFFNEMVLSFNDDYTQTTKQKIKSDLVINCAGLYCDKIASLAGEKLDVRIIPFRGEYYTISPKKAHMVQNLIYPVPDANFPFLGVHFTRRITGEIEAGPNAVFAFKREGYRKTDFNLAETLQSLLWRGFQKVAFRYWKTGIGEFYRSFSKSAFTRALQELVPEIQKEDLEVAPAGVRAQACDKNGNLIDDFYIQESERFIHVLNAPSPAATSSLSIGLTISEKVIERFHQ
ncbi:MAG: L-2-hydroxyglutarate oxidase [Bacteroidia bacterium]